MARQVGFAAISGAGASASGGAPAMFCSVLVSVCGASARGLDGGSGAGANTGLVSICGNAE